MLNKLVAENFLTADRAVCLCAMILSTTLVSSAWASELHVAQIQEEGTSAVAVIHATDGNTVTGTVRFTQTATGMNVEAQLTGIAEGSHGFHIHQYGDCSAADGTSAGGHFNPGHVDHAGPHADSRHVGDLGNITADSEENATYSGFNDFLTFEGENNIIGRAVIVHAHEDDLSSQPTGAAGPRIGCGVVGFASPQAE